jgi:putative transposase
MSRGHKRTLIPTAYAEHTAWPTPDVSGFSRQIQDIYSNRKAAIEMYLAACPFSEIRDRTGKSEEEIRRLLKRCIIVSEDGNIWGFRALIPGMRIKNYTRKADVQHVKGSGSAGCAGALEQLFSRFPDIRELVHDLFLKADTSHRIHEARISLDVLHDDFVKALRQSGVTEFDWPFNTANRGYQALSSYCRHLRETHLGRGMLARSGREAARRGNVNNGRRTLIPNLRPYSFTQLDFHKVDAASIIVIRNEYGKEFEVPISRWHIGFLVEERYGTILGAYVALERTPSGDSTLEIVESALVPENIADDDPRYRLIPDKKALAIQLMPELRYQCFSALRVDNAWSNAAHEVVNNIMDTVGCTVNFGPTYSWWRRSLIEKIFGELTRMGLQRLPSTHGSGPGDTRVSDPNGQAIKFRLLLSELISVVFKCIRNHNTRPTERLHWTSPMEALKVAMTKPASGFIYQPLPKATQTDLRLLMHIEEVTVRGNIEKNERPYFVLGRCRYTNPELANSYWLVGKKLITYTNRRRCRLVSATVKDTGAMLGEMTPSGRWANSECSWRDRKLINQSGMAESHARERDDPVVQLLERKAERILKRPQSKKKHSSSDALKVAQIAMNQSHEPVQVPTPVPRPKQADVGPPLKPDPFGLNDMPKIEPISIKR